METKTISKNWNKINIQKLQGSRFTLGDDNLDWVYELLGWQKLKVKRKNKN